VYNLRNLYIFNLNTQNNYLQKTMCWTCGEEGKALGIQWRLLRRSLATSFPDDGGRGSLRKFGNSFPTNINKCYSHSVQRLRQQFPRQLQNRPGQWSARSRCCWRTRKHQPARKATLNFYMQYWCRRPTDTQTTITQSLFLYDTVCHMNKALR
jgi:hypothetical protein